jgi:alpha-1,6-mannosyltransferase
MTQSTDKPTATALLALLGLGIAVAWGVAVALVADGRNPILVYNGAFAIAFLLYLFAAALVLSPRVGALGRWGLPLILVLALLPRLVLLSSSPALSDDLYRYIWDGKVIAAGIDPYRYAPDAPELAALRDRLWEPVNQKSQHTPYPPAAQAVFALTYQLAPGSIKAQQIVATLADLAVVGALLLLLARLGLPRERVLIYAWSPLPMLHFAHSAHNDALMIAPLVLALALVVGPQGASRAARIGSGLALAFGGLVKLAPLLLAPPLLRRWRIPGTLALGVGLVLGSAPFLRPDLSILNGLGTEAGEAVFNDSVRYVLLRLLAPLGTSASTVVSLLSAAALVAASLALLLRPPADDLGLVRGAATLLGLAILLNAVVEPWYLVWMLPFVTVLLRPGTGPLPFALTPLLGWLWLSGAVQLTDLTYLGPEMTRWWPAIRAVEYGPLFLLLALAGYDFVRQRRTTPA